MTPVILVLILAIRSEEPFLFPLFIGRADEDELMIRPILYPWSDVVIRDAILGDPALIQL